MTTMPTTAAGGRALVAGTSLWADAWKRLRRNRLAVASGIVILFLAVACGIGPWAITATGQAMWP